MLATSKSLRHSLPLASPTLHLAVEDTCFRNHVHCSNLTNIELFVQLPVLFFLQGEEITASISTPHFPSLKSYSLMCPIQFQNRIVIKLRHYEIYLKVRCTKLYNYVRWTGVDSLQFKTAFWLMGVSRHGSFVIPIWQFLTTDG